MSSIVEARSLAKTYGEVVALDGLNLTVDSSHIYDGIRPKKGRQTTWFSV